MAELERPESHISHDLVQEAENHEGTPAPMVSVRGIDKPQLLQLIHEYNGRQSGKWASVYLSLVNTRNQFVVSGMTAPLAKFVRWVRGKCAQPDDSQSRVPFSQRKPNAKMSYLTINGPYHCELLQSVIDKQRAYAYEKGWVLDAADLRFAVRASNDGHDLRGEQDLTRHLFECTCALPVDWPAAVGIPDETHVVDFSPGRFSAFGMFTHSVLEGRGITVISTSAILADPFSPLGSKAELFKEDIADVIEAHNWQKQFAPRLVRTAHDDQLHIDTPMHRVLGMPPLMVGGMTPTTVNEKFVGAISQAGYHVELAGGGIFTREALEAKVNSLMQYIRPGQGITLNGIYLNQRLWAFHYSEILRLRRAGFPITGVCIGAGVPSLEVANEIIQSFRVAGLQHVSFKPGTAGAIRKVVQIAHENPDFPVILQWTGGRAGGHHSCEDFHQPLLETYAAIRGQQNIVLVVGSGFGDADGTIPYLTGDWSLTYGRAPMPADGILVASRVMTALEAGTSLAGKQLLAQTPGLVDSEWEKTYVAAAGGIITTPSEYGELMHAVATRSAIFCREMHDTILSKPRDKLLPLLEAKRDYIIARLNADHVRPWFGRKADGRVVDLEEMTYLEVSLRLAELMYIQRPARWIDPSYLVLFGDFIRHIEDRFSGNVHAYELQTIGEISDPVKLVHWIVECYPAMCTQLLTSSDATYFIALCRRRGQKPVPFIPVLDKDFASWLLKDTIGQSEDIDSVFDQDIQRTTILQGPVAARYVTKVNEPVKDILDGIYRGQIAALLHRFYGGNKWMVPVDDYIGCEPAPLLLPDSVQRHMLEDSWVYQLPDNGSQLPDLKAWVDTLTGPRKSWLHALLTAPVITQGSKFTDNFVRSIMRPRPGQVVSVHLVDGVPMRIRVSRRNQVATDVDLSADICGNISLTIYHSVHGRELPVEFMFIYRPDTPYALIREVMDERDSRICLPMRAIASIGDGCREPFESVVDMTNPTRPYGRSGFLVTEEFVAKYCRAVGNRCAHYQPREMQQMQAPMDALFVIATPGLFKFLTMSPLNEGVLDMLHLGYQCSFSDAFRSLKVGDTVDYEVSMQELVNVVGGKRLVLNVHFYSMGSSVASLSTSFHYRGSCISQSVAFRYVKESRIELALQSPSDAAILRGRDWFVPSETADADLVPGSVLEFELYSQYRFKTDT
ncbi:fatty acid synthase alpha subunit Lsd1, partial [Linderina pennispora]